MKLLNTTELQTIEGGCRNLSDWFKDKWDKATEAIDKRVDAINALFK